MLLTIFFAFSLVQNNPVFKQTRDANEEIFKIGDATFLWLSLFLMQVSFGAFYNFFTIYETDHGISLEIVSYLWAFGVICEIVLFYFQAPIFKHFNLVTLVKIAILATAFRWLLLFLFPDSLAISFASQSLHAFSFALHHTAAISLLYTLYRDKKLAAQFYYGFSFGLGGFVGALLAGYFYGEYLYLYASLIALLSLLSFSFFKEKE